MDIKHRGFSRLSFPHDAVEGALSFSNNISILEVESSRGKSPDVEELSNIL